MSNTITLRDVYEIVQRLEDKVDKRFDEQDKRLNQLEGFENKVVGYSGGLSIVISLAISYIKDFVFKK